MPYCLLFAPAADRQFRKLDRATQIRLGAAISALAADPRPAAATRLVGTPNGYRLRVGDYRVLYDLSDRDLTVLVLRVAHRREAYR